MALLETMTAEEAIKHGVTVYPHVTEPAQTVAASIAIAATCAALDRGESLSIPSLGIVIEPKAQPLDVSRFNVPAWARWIAADENGLVCAYDEHEPREGINALREGVYFTGGRYESIGAINMHGIDWRQTLTPVPAQPSDWMQAHIAAEVAAIDAQPQTWCEKCNLPDDICRGHDEPAPPALAWQLSMLDGDGITALARQLAQADSTKASLIAEALWSEAMDVEHARLCADDTVMEDSNRRAVEAAPVANYSIGDRVVACGHPAAIVAVNANVGVYTVKFDAPQTLGALVPFTTCLLSDEQLQPNNIADDDWDTMPAMAGA